MVEADIIMKTVTIDGVKVAYRVEYSLNKAIITIYVKHRMGLQVRSNKVNFVHYRDYSRAMIRIDTKNCETEDDVIAKAITDLQIYTFIKVVDPRDKMFIKEIFKALE